MGMAKTVKRMTAKLVSRNSQLDVHSTPWILEPLNPHGNNLNKGNFAI